MLTELLETTKPAAGLASGLLRPKLEAAIPAAKRAAILILSEPGWKDVARRAAVPSQWPRAAPFDTGLITMTSGTSGKPKALAVPVISLAMAAVARDMRYPYNCRRDGQPASQEREAVNVMFVWEAIRPLCFGQVALCPS